MDDDLIAGESDQPERLGPTGPERPRVAVSPAQALSGWSILAGFWLAIVLHLAGMLNEARAVELSEAAARSPLLGADRS